MLTFLRTIVLVYLSSATY